MTMFGVVIIVSLTFLAGTSYGKNGQRCTCNMVHHVQEEFCNSDYALHVMIHAGVPSPLPGERDLGDINNKYMKYEVEVVESFKEDDFEKGQIINVYSPRHDICGKPGLMDEIRGGTSNEYLFVGDIGQIEDGDEFMVITNCNWVEPWEDIGESQRDGLRGMYTDCSCTIFPVSGPMDIGDTNADRFSYDNCFFNPVKAQVLKVKDCETLHGFCLRQSDRTCRWENTDAFQQCFATRKSSLTTSAAAVTTKEGCKLFSGRKKRQCLLKFLKNRNNGRK